MTDPHRPPNDESTALLAVYLRDHHAGATAGAALARRVARAHQGSSHGEALEHVAREIEQDRQTLEGLMARLQIAPSGVKDGLARAAELAGRFKFNRRIVRRSPLSDVMELEALSLGILGKAKLWQALATFDQLPAASGADPTALAERAQRQHDVVESCRREAAATALRQS